MRLILVVEFKGEILRLWAPKPAAVAMPGRIRWDSDSAEEYAEVFDWWLSPEGRLPCPVCGELGLSPRAAWQAEERGAKVIWADWMKEDPPFGLQREREEAP